MAKMPAFRLWLPMSFEKSSFQLKMRLKLSKFSGVTLRPLKPEMLMLGMKFAAL